MRLSQSTHQLRRQLFRQTCLRLAQEKVVPITPTRPLPRTHTLRASPLGLLLIFWLAISALTVLGIWLYIIILIANQIL